MEALKASPQLTVVRGQVGRATVASDGIVR